MTLMTKPYMQTGNARLLPIDMNDPTLVLYYPFWYQHGDMTGNPIYSYDKGRYSGTVQGAVWGSEGKGRIFAGGDDYIELTNAAMNFTSGDFSILSWIKVPNVTGQKMILCRGVAATDGYYFSTSSDALLVETFNDTGTQSTTTAAVSLIANTWHCCGMTRSGASVKIYIEGVDATDTAGVHVNPKTCSRTVKIGIYDTKVHVPFYGTMGEVLVYSRQLPASEILNYYLSMKWRYS